MLIYGFGNPPTAEAPKGIAERLFEAFLRRDSLAGAGPMPTHVGDVVVTPSSEARWFRMWVVTDDAQQAPTAGQWLRHVEGLERAKAQLGSTPARTVCSSSTARGGRTGADRRYAAVLVFYAGRSARGRALAAVAVTITAPPINVNEPGDSPCTSQVHIGLSTGSMSSSSEASSADT